MASSINASTTAGVVTTADTSGVLNLQTAGTTAISIDASQAVSFTNSPTVTGGTANGVAYLNGSKVLTTGSALTYDSNTLSISSGTTPFSLKRTGAGTTLIELKQSGIDGGYIGTTGANNFTFYNASASDLITLNNTGLKTKTTISVGDATPSASGAGITFPATQSASTDANTLDDYEEGTWTPVVNGTSLSSAGWYVKIGRNVYVGFNNVTGVAPISNNADFAITGFPFSIKTDGGSGNYKFGGAASININDDSDSYKMLPMVGRMQNTSNPFGGTNRSGVLTTTADPFNFSAFYVSD